MRRKNLIFILILLPFLFGSFNFCLAQSSAEEAIEDYRIKMDINKEGLMEVEEIIDYDFGANWRHGIFRTLPLKLTFEGSDKYVPYDINILQVTDENGQPYQYALSEQSGVKVVKIGDPNKTITGRHVYDVLYTVGPVILGYDDHDEFNWDIIGVDWTVPIKKAEATVSSEQFIDLANWEIKCYTGVYGSEEQDCSLKREGNAVIVELSKELASGEAMTLFVPIPKGLFVPAYPQSLRSASHLWLALIPLALLFCAFWLQKKIPKGQKVRKPIIAQFEPDKDLSVFESARLVYQGSAYIGRFYTALLVDLAIRGYLVMKNIPGKKLSFIIIKNDDFELTRINKSVEGLRDFEEKFMSALFRYGDKFKISWMGTDSELQEAKKEVNSMVKDKLVEKKLFLESKTGLMAVCTVLACLAIFLSFSILSFLPRAFGFAFFIAVLAAFMTLLHKVFASGRLTALGAEKKRYLLGLKEYIKVAEKYRLEFHNAPEKNAEHFEKLLPYAIIFDLVDEWSKYCADVIKENPRWYMGSVAFSASAFAGVVNSFSSSVASSVSPRSSAGGGGGSGGGGGGGGGGSW